MKRMLAVLVLLAAGGLAKGQDFIAPQAPKREIVPAPEVRPRMNIEGIVKEIFVEKKPWQMVNPAAPAKYGTGEKFVSKDFGPSTPYHSSGWIVAGVEW